MPSFRATGFQVSGHTSGAACGHGRQWLGPPGKRAKVVTRSAGSTGACKFCRLSRAQAERFLEEFRARLAKFGLDLSSGQDAVDRAGCHPEELWSVTCISDNEGSKEKTTICQQRRPQHRRFRLELTCLNTIVSRSSNCSTDGSPTRQTFTHKSNRHTGT